MKLFLILLGVCLLWITLAQSCMRMRTSDSVAIKNFSEKNVKLRTYNFTSGGHNIHYVATGSDTLPTLIFIHGSPGSWDAFADYLKDSLLLLHYRMISIDRPGFGYSDYGDAMSLNAQIPLLADLLKHIENGKPMCLIGHSLGGPAVVKLAGEYPELPVTNLVILAGSVDPSEEKPENWRSTLDRTPLRWLVPGAMRPSNAELLLFKKDVDDLASDFPKVKCNVLIMHGDKDDFVPPGNAIYSQNHLVNA
ncbi:MAG TPA: alpha/beta hydrolase, partial [Chitinophagaceae bacterium]|nr:alpha/beta hydrolase [Chitinophagaceae bacterium]